MGKTSVFVEVNVVLEMTSLYGYSVTEASKKEYFFDNTWKDEVVSSESMDDGSYKFELQNGDFVVLEKGGAA